MVNTKLNLSMTEPYVRQIYAKEGDTGRVLEIGLEDYPTENGTLRILRPDGVEKTSDALSTVSPTITDGMATFDSLEEAEVTELEIALSPKQDLHGYANPYPSGGGKNKIDDTIKTVSGNSLLIGATTTAEYPFHLKVGTYRLTVFRTTSASQIYGYLKTSTSDNIIAINNQGGSTPSGTVNITTEGDYRIWIYGANGSTVDGSITHVSLTEGSDAVTEYIPYSNICPIYPSNGKNHFKFQNVGRTDGGVTYTLNDDGTVSLANTATANSFLIGNVADNMCMPLKAGTYTLSGGLSSNIRLVASSYANGTSTTLATDLGQGASFTITEEKNVYVNIRVQSGQSTDVTLKPQIELGTTATPYVPYQGINMYQSGKNLFDKTVTTNGYVKNAYQNDNNTQSMSANFDTSEYIPVYPSTSYTLSGIRGSDPSVCFYDDAYNFLIGYAYRNDTTKTVTSPSNAKYMRASIPITNKDIVQIEQGSTATAYEPYNGTTYPLLLGQSVYGGTLDVVSGKLVVDRGYVDLGSLTWTYAENYKSFSATLAGVKNVEQTETPNLLSSMYQAGSWYLVATDPTKNGYVYVLPSYNQLRARNLNYNDGTVFQNAMNGVQLVYELATPIEVDLTPTQITTLLGENNVWSDGEITELTFEYDGLLSLLTADQTAVVGRCIGDVDFNGASTMPFTLVVKPNNKE